MTTQFRSWVSGLIEIKLKNKLGKCNTEVEEKDGVRWIMPKPRTEDVEPSANVTDGKGAGYNSLENRRE